jgi:hypothetical protein
MKKMMRVIALVMLATLTMVSASATRAAEYTSPQSMLLTYYNTINRGDYINAYNLWLNPGQTYQAFAGGFAATVRVEPYLGVFQNTGVPQVGYVPAVLLGYQTDGTVYSYYGCFAVNYLGYNGLTWRIAESDFHLIATQSAPVNAVIQAYLGIDCFNVPTGITVNTASMTSNVAAPTILAYYDAINRKYFASAYAYWLQPLPGPKPNGAPAQDYRPSFTQFQNGYINTAYVNVYFGDYNRLGPSAGHSYLDGLLPVVLVGQQIDGTFAAFSGCYVMGYLPNGALGIVNGSFTLFANDVPTGDIILQNVNIDCTQLGIPN